MELFRMNARHHLHEAFSACAALRLGIEARLHRGDGEYQQRIDVKARADFHGPRGELLGLGHGHAVAAGNIGRNFLFRDAERVLFFRRHAVRVSLFPRGNERISSRVLGFFSFECERFSGNLSLHGRCRIARDMKADGSRNGERSDDACRPEALQNGLFLLVGNGGWGSFDFFLHKSWRRQTSEQGEEKNRALPGRSLDAPCGDRKQTHPVCVKAASGRDAPKCIRYVSRTAFAWVLLMGIQSVLLRVFSHGEDWNCPEISRKPAGGGQR